VHLKEANKIMERATLWLQKKWLHMQENMIDRLVDWWMLRGQITELRPHLTRQVMQLEAN
jgi:hypothetical protein